MDIKLRMANDSLEQELDVLGGCTLLFQTTVEKGPISKSEVSAKLCKKWSRKIHPDESVVERIDQIWKERKAANPKLFNGTKFRLAGLSESNLPHFVSLRLSVTNYGSFLGTNYGSFVQMLIQDGITNCGDGRAYMSDPLGVGAVCLTSDEKIVLIRRSMHVGEFPGFFDVPGGHPEPSRVQGCGDEEWSWSLDSDSCGVDSSALINEFFGSISDEVHCEVPIL